MARTILIPTDFSVRLLKLIFRAIEDNPESAIHFVLVHRVQLSDSITDLLFSSRSKLLESLQSKEFKESCQIIQSRYRSNIKSMNIKLFSGYNGNAFKNFVEGNKIDEIYRPLNYQMQLKNPKSLDIIPLLAKIQVDIVDVDMKSATRTISQDSEQLSDLFFQPVVKKIS